MPKRQEGTMQFPPRSRLSAVHTFLADAGRPPVAEVRHLNSGYYWNVVIYSYMLRIQKNIRTKEYMQGIVVHKVLV